MSSEIQRISVCGAGTMGGGVAQVAAQSGAQVTLYDPDAGSLRASRSRMESDLAAQVAKARLAQSDADGVMSRLHWTDKLATVAGSDMVVEAIVEDVSIKQALFAELEALLGDDAIIATNTSSLPIGRLARMLRRPGRFAGMHFFNPATAMKLVEIVAGPASEPEAIDRIEAYAKSWGKFPVRVADVPGFIVNRVARPYYAEAFRAMQEGAATPVLIDHLFRHSAGFRMGPLELTDLIGQDVNFAVARSVYDSYFGQTRFTPQLAQAALVDAGRLGRKTGRGVYDYGEGAAPVALPDAAAGQPLAGSWPRPLSLSPEMARLEVDGTMVRMTRGLTARQEARAARMPVALLDWFSPESARAIGFAASDETAARVAASLAEDWSIAAWRLADRPGLLVARTLAQIANAAGDAVLEHVATPDDIDAALRYGANYPFGPFAWARTIGAAGLCRLLDNVAETTGQPMYRPSQYWTARADD